MVSYGFKKDFGSVISNRAVYATSGHDTPEEAKFTVYWLAFNSGFWKPRQLRNKWWQIWRPVEHDEIEKRVVAAAKGGA